MKKVLATLVLIVLVVSFGSISIMKFYKYEDEIKAEKFEALFKGTNINLVCKKQVNRTNITESYTMNITFKDDMVLSQALEIYYAYGNEKDKTTDLEKIKPNIFSTDEKYEGIISQFTNAGELDVINFTEFDIKKLSQEEFFNSKEQKKYYDFVLKTKDEFKEKIKNTEYVCQTVNNQALKEIVE